jgi:hypothetical protein
MESALGADPKRKENIVRSTELRQRMGVLVSVKEDVRILVGTALRFLSLRDLTDRSRRLGVSLKMAISLGSGL